MFDNGMEFYERVWIPLSLKKSYQNFKNEEDKILKQEELILPEDNAFIDLFNESHVLTSLLLAVRSNSTRMVKFLLDRGADVYSFSRDDTNSYETILHTAIRIGNLQIIDLLLDSKYCDVNARSRTGETALSYAASLNDLAIVKKLIKKKANFCADNNGLTPFHVAVQNNSAEVTRYFLDTLKIDVNIETENGENAMHFAVQNKNIEMVYLLIKRGFDVNYCAINYKSPLPLYTAVFSNSSEIFDLLVEAGADIYSALSYDRECNMLNEAVKNSNHYLTKKLLTFGADVNKFNRNLFAPLVIRQHISKLKAANLPLRNAISKLMNRKVYSECKEEVTRMRVEKIGGSNISYYDLLIKNIDQLTSLARNKSIVEAVNFEKWKTEFPFYGEMLVRTFQKGQKRLQLIGSAEENLEFLYLRLPYDCVREILMYLSIGDLFKCSSSSKH